MVVHPPRPRGPHGRDALVDELIEVYLAEGFSHLQLADLAARLRCSKSTLYAIAPSKEQIIVTAVRAFFRRATARVEEALHGHQGTGAVGIYLEAIAAELRPAQSAFYADVEAFEPAREIYRQNVQHAIERVQGLVRSIDAAPGPLTSAFVGAVAGTLMMAIQRGEIASVAGLDDAAAYHQLAALLGAPVQKGPVDDR